MGNVIVKQSSRLTDLINYRLRVITQDGRVYIGELMAFDKHMNLVLNNCVEERIPKTQIGKLRNDVIDQNIKVEKRILGLTILRGELVLSTVVVDKPLLTKRERLAGVKKQEKHVQKQRRQRADEKSNGNTANSGRVAKPNTAPSTAANSTSRYATANDNAELQNGNVPLKRKFQPPPGFKRR